MLQNHLRIWIVNFRRDKFRFNHSSHKKKWRWFESPKLSNKSDLSCALFSSHHFVLRKLKQSQPANQKKKWISLFIYFVLMITTIKPNEKLTIIKHKIWFKKKYLKQKSNQDFFLILSFNAITFIFVKYMLSFLNVSFTLSKNR